MEVSITQFRRDLFALVNQALEGKDLWVTHKGRRFKLVPERTAGSRLTRITPLEVINPESPTEFPDGEGSLQKEMFSAWERDWSTL